MQQLVRLDVGLRQPRLEVPVDPRRPISPRERGRSAPDVLDAISDDRNLLSEGGGQSGQIRVGVRRPASAETSFTCSKRLRVKARAAPGARRPVGKDALPGSRPPPRGPNGAVDGEEGVRPRPTTATPAGPPFPPPPGAAKQRGEQEAAHRRSGARRSTAGLRRRRRQARVSAIGGLSSAAGTVRGWRLRPAGAALIVTSRTPQPGQGEHRHGRCGAVTGEEGEHPCEAPAPGTRRDGRMRATCEAGRQRHPPEPQTTRATRAAPASPKKPEASSGLGHRSQRGPHLRSRRAPSLAVARPGGPEVGATRSAVGVEGNVRAHAELSTRSRREGSGASDAASTVLASLASIMCRSRKKVSRSMH